MIELVYVSQARRQFRQHELVDLLVTARNKNSQMGLSGMLLYDGLGTFIQVLEGNRAAVQTIYDRICQDPRHENIQLLHQVPIQHANFGDWSMGFHAIEDEHTAGIDGFNDFLNTDNRLDFLKQNGGMAKDLLLYFKGVANNDEALHV